MRVYAPCGVISGRMFGSRFILTLSVFWEFGLLLGQFTDGLNVEFGKNRCSTGRSNGNTSSRACSKRTTTKRATVAGQVAVGASRQAIQPLLGKPLAGPIQVLVFKSQRIPTATPVSWRQTTKRATLGAPPS